MNSEKIIHENILIEELVEEYPQLVKPLMEKGIVCLICGEPAWGTLKEQADAKNVPNLQAIIDEMNKLINP